MPWYSLSEADGQSTYRYLRIAMPLLVILLGASIAWQIFEPAPDCWLGSISAYYYTSARAVFVACLCAIGACLVIYRGHTAVEDLALNISGLLAFGVAFVPTPLTDLQIKPTDAVCRRSNVPTESQLATAIDNNVFALLVALSAILLVALVLRPWKGGKPGLDLTGDILLLGFALLLGWYLYVADRALIRDYAHLVSSVTMFAGIFFVVLMNVLRIQHASKPDRTGVQIACLRWYWLVLALMAASVAVLSIAAWTGSFDHAVFWLEASLIALFGMFWVVQTKELWA